MYNKTKRNIEKTSAILCIFIGIFIYLHAVLAIMTIEAGSQPDRLYTEIKLLFLQDTGGFKGDYYNSFYYDILEVYAIIAFELQVIVCISMITIGGLLNKAPKLINNEYKSSRGKKLTLISMLGILLLLILVPFCQNSLDGFTAILFIPITIAFSLLIASLCLKDVNK